MGPEQAALELLEPTATRAGLVVAVVVLPGPFVAKAFDPSGHDILFDPFDGGRFLDAAGCEELVSAVTGRPFELTAKEVAAMPPGMIAVRMLNNLKGRTCATRTSRGPPV